MKIVFPLLVAFFGYLVAVSTFFETAGWTIAEAGFLGFVYKVLFMIIPALVASWMVEIVIINVKEYVVIHDQKEDI